MRFYVGKVYTEDGLRSFHDKVYYKELNKNAVLRVEEGWDWKRKYKKSIDGELYTPDIVQIVCKNRKDTLEEARGYLDAILRKENVKDIKLVEVEESNLSSELWHDAISSYNNIFLEYSGLKELRNFIGSSEICFDWLNDEKYSKSKIINLAKYSINSSHLLKEIKNIYSSKNSGSIKDGTPVHYILKGYNKNAYYKSVNLLINSLSNNNRLYSEHVFKFNFDKMDERYYRSGRWGFRSEKELYNSVNENLAECLSGHPILLEYGLEESNGNYNYVPYSLLSKFIEKIKPVMDNTPLIFGIPEKNNDLENRIRKMLDAPCVVIDVDKRYNPSNKTYTENITYLNNKAKNMGIASDSKLSKMLKDKMEDKSFKDIDKLFDEWKSEKLIDAKFPEYSDSLITMKELRNRERKDALAQLDELIGLKEVKQQIKDFLARFKMNQELKRKGLPTDEFSMHMAFIGNPGTGKTEVAKLFGQIYKEAGVLKENRVLVVNGSQPFGIEETFKKAKGSVLFIDEAYALCSYAHEKEGTRLASLIAEMENNREDTVVIFAGYKGAMERLFSSNLGFKSRLGFVLEFPDYTQDELLEIFKLFARRNNKILPEQTIQDARDILWRGGRRSDQGNARFVRKFFEDCCGNQLTRVAKEHENSNKEYTDKELRTILPIDLDRKYSEGKTGEEQLKELIGLSSVKEFVNDRINQMVIQKVRRDTGLKSDFIPMHMAFTGNPGTGKTEVARLMGKTLNEKGVLSVGDFYECHPGEIAHPLSIDNLFYDARGSVIFIDEAYSISNWPSSLLAALIKNLEDYREEIIVIFAGYKNEIKEMLRSNPGFESRVKTIISFPDYSEEELWAILKHMCKKNNFKIDNSTKKQVLEIVKEYKNKKNFANGRFIRNLFEQAQIKQASRLLKNKNSADIKKQDLQLLIPEDFNVTFTTAEREFKPVGFKLKSA